MMYDDNDKTPIVMTFSGHDPTGGAGIQADIEALLSIGCHCVPIVTAITAQDTQNVKDLFATDSVLVIEQARAILEDMPISAFKIGVLGSVDNIQAIHTIMLDYPDIPVIFDPIIQASGGAMLSSDEMVSAMCTLLIPHCTIMTPNFVEAQEIGNNADSIDACASEMLAYGCQNILITDVQATGREVVNNLYHQRGLVNSYRYQRLDGSFHGSGCTLASALAGYLSHGSHISDAVEQAQKFTWESLKHARRIGCGQLIPNRLFWSNNE